MVSNKGQDAFAGVSLVASLDVLLVTLFSSLNVGGAVVLAQSMGRGDKKHTCEAAKQLCYVSVITAAAISLIVLIFRIPLLTLLFGEAEKAVMQNAQSYFLFIALSFPFLAIEYSVAAIFRTQGDTMISLKISIFMNLLNIVGNAILIYVFNLGAMGAAIATLFSRMVGAVVVTIIAHNKKRFIYLERIFHYRPDLSIIKEILRIGIPNAIESSMFHFGRLVTSSLVSSLGTMAIAANAAAHSVANLHYAVGGAFQSTMAAVVGRCIGAEEKSQAKHYTRSILFSCYGVLFAVIGLVTIFSVPLLRLFGLPSDSTGLAQQLLFYHNIVAVLIWPTAFCLSSAFRAANDIKFSMVVSVISMWIFRVALGYVLALDTVSVFGLFSFSGLGLGVMGVWIAMTVDWGIRAVFFAIRWLTDHWLKHFDKEQASKIQNAKE
jgi:putative MATE family efflux protein